MHIDGLVQERRNSSALAMELRLSCSNPSICQQSSLCFGYLFYLYLFQIYLYRVKHSVTLIFHGALFYPVLCPKLTLIQPTWSAYPYAPTSLYGIHMPLLPYMVIQSIVLHMALLWAAIDSALSQGPLLWRHNDMTVIVSRNTRGRERDTRQRLDNANARRLQTVNR